MSKSHYETRVCLHSYREETPGVTYQQRLDNEKIRKKRTHVRAKEKEHRDEVKELRRELEVLRRLRVKNTVSDSDV